MFTGLVRECAKVVALDPDGESTALVIEAPETAKGAAIGDSIAVNGVCLTVTSGKGDQLTFCVVGETLSRTTIGRLTPEDRANVEPSLSVGDRFGGHFVQGHVEGVARIESITPRGDAREFDFSAPHEILRYVVSKGAVALDGVSLTVVDAAEDHFTAWLIPHTLQTTTFGIRQVGDLVNIEPDILSKYVEKLLGR